MIIYDVVNIFSMKNYKSSRKLRVGLNWYPGVNWSTTTSTAQPVKFVTPCSEVRHPHFMAILKSFYCPVTADMYTLPLKEDIPFL